MRTRFSRIHIERKFQHIWKLILENRNISIRLGEGGNTRPAQSTIPSLALSTRGVTMRLEDKGVLASQGHLSVPWGAQGGDIPSAPGQLPLDLVASTSHFCLSISFQS